VNRRITVAGVLALGFTAVLTAPAQAADSEETIYVPDDFVASLSDTRAGGDYAVEGTALHIWTAGTKDITGDGKDDDKVAEYLRTETPLSDVADDEPALEYQGTADYKGNPTITPPGFQLVVDLNDDGKKDGILVGETAYNGDWWLASATPSGDLDLTATAPGAGHGYAHAGTLEEWSDAYDDAVVTAFGFSLGSGVVADGRLEAINFAGTRYTFAEHTVLEGKGDCKSGGWATSTKPAFRNQGQCVSHFAAQGRTK
jgi:hypothetical protein